VNDELEQRIRKALDELRTERDDLRVRLHLAGRELKEEWDELEEKWEHFEDRAENVRKEAAAASRDVLGALDLLGEELGRAYKRIRHRLVD
jgi:predicted Holliday junction resolvase-like endonuclease